jgi:RNA polymerase sigma-70 factor (ECF subfamily)
MDSNQTQALAAKAVAGDADALSALLEHVGPQVENALHIGRRWRSAIDVGDVMQVTYLEAFLQISRFDPVRSPGSAGFLRWLRTIAANNLRDAIRGLSGHNRPPAEHRVAHPDLDDSASAFIEQLGFTSTTPSRAARRGEASRLLLAAIDRLPPDYREVVRQYDLDGKPIGDVASSIGRSPGAVHMLRTRAHARLRELLGEYSDVLESRA